MTLKDGRSTVLEMKDVEAFADSLEGRLLPPGSPDYDQARRVWNGMVDRRPGLIVECGGAPDVVRSVRFAADHELLLSVKGGGHSIAGSGVCQGGLMISLGRMRWVQVDPEARRARVGPGTLLADLDREAQVFGLATPLGINSTTGVAGLTLGGGFGWLSRKHGLTIDNLVSADVVTAAGDFLVASRSENPDLFWGIRGGGGNLGVVTSFEFRLHPVGPEVLAGLLVHSLASAGPVLRFYRDFVARAPDELTVWAVLRKAPPLPFLPPEIHGSEILILACLFAGDVQDGEKALAPLRTFGSPAADVIRPRSYLDFQSAFDPFLQAGQRNYWKSHYFRQLDDGLFEAVLPLMRGVPNQSCEVLLAHLGGAVGRIPEDATAYPHRDARFLLNVHGRWHDPSQDEGGRAWTREVFRAAEPYATGGVYANFMPGEEEGRVRAAYGPAYGRLRRLKTRYDPGNLFRLNPNVSPGP
jgi:FAD/FMN-containing dehydrogenase